MPTDGDLTVETDRDLIRELQERPRSPATSRDHPCVHAFSLCMIAEAHDRRLW